MQVIAKIKTFCGSYFLFWLFLEKLFSVSAIFSQIFIHSGYFWSGCFWFCFLFQIYWLFWLLSYWLFYFHRWLHEHEPKKASIAAKGNKKQLTRKTNPYYSTSIRSNVFRRGKKHRLWNCLTSQSKEKYQNIVGEDLERIILQGKGVGKV